MGFSLVDFTLKHGAGVVAMFIKEYYEMTGNKPPSGITPQEVDDELMMYLKARAQNYERDGK